MTMHTANGHDEAADLPALAAGTLTPEARTRAEAHLAGCAACRAELAAWHAVTAATGHLAEAVAEPSPDVLAGALARIEPRTPARRPRRWAVRVPRAWIAVGVAACVALALVLVTRTGPQQAGPPVLLAAGQGERSLTAAAAAAAARPGPVLSGSDLWYWKVRSADFITTSDPSGPPDDPKSWRSDRFEPVVTETWLRADGANWSRMTAPAEPTFFSEAERERWRREPGATPAAHELQRYPDSKVGGSYDAWIRRLPGDDDDRLLELLWEESRSTFEARRKDNPAARPGFDIFSGISNLVGHPALRPDQRAALYRVASRVPGVQSLGKVRDPLGRPGLAVGFDHDQPGWNIRMEIVFDPATGELLATKEVLTAPRPGTDAKPGTVVDYDAVECAGVVDAPGDTTCP
jgi:hypothetical protein